MLTLLMLLGCFKGLIRDVLELRGRDDFDPALRLGVTIYEW